jgi:alkyl sulfatase BDS1-like metallo-beta-lactamase superfamily hydrolase
MAEGGGIEWGGGALAGRRPGTHERVADGVTQFHGFCNVGLVHGGGAALVVDTSNPALGPRAVAALRELSAEPVETIVYTHGHVDHVGGVRAFLDDATGRGHSRPVIWAQERVPVRFERYQRTWAWNDEVNRRQFQVPAGLPAFPRRFVPPDRTYRDRAELTLAGEPVELVHAEAETDDATWVWLPQREVALVGDLVVHSVPNTGNPNKPQRFTLGWAEALEAIAARRPRAIVPGHGPPVAGERVQELLLETARALRFLHDAVLDRLNAGLWPDEVVDLELRLPDDLAAKPYLQPIYGCAPFVVRDVLRAYAGWWGGNPAELLPAKRRDVARDLLEVAGRDALLARARALLASGEARRALHLATWPAQADPSDAEARALVAEVCDALASSEPSFIARNFYRGAAARARERGD